LRSSGGAVGHLFAQIGVDLVEKTAGGEPALLGADEQVLATSDGPDGNIGFPAQAAEIQHFMSMLKKTATRLTAAQLGTIEEALKAKPTEAK